MRYKFYLLFFICFLLFLNTKNAYTDGGQSDISKPPSFQAKYEPQSIEESSQDYSEFGNIKKPNFIDYESLSDIIGFEVAILAFFIPLAIDMISRLSDRYASESIVKSFESERLYRWLPWVLAFNIAFVIFVKAFNIVLPKSFSYLTVIIAVGLNFWILALLSRIKRYLISPDYVKDKLFKIAEEAIK